MKKGNVTTVGNFNPARMSNAIAAIISARYGCRVTVKEIIKKEPDEKAG